MNSNQRQLSAMSQPQPTVYLVDDDESVCTALGMVIEAEGLRVQHFQSAEGFLHAYPADSVGCLVLDVHMPDMDGLSLQQALAKRHPHLPIVFITGAADVASATQAFRSGASDFFQKPIDIEALLKRIRECLEQQVVQREKASCKEKARAGVAQLTPRERDVLRLAVAGQSNKEIGRALGISYRTVEIHRSHVMEKLGASTLSELIHKIWGCTEFCENGLLNGDCGGLKDMPPTE